MEKNHGHNSSNNFWKKNTQLALKNFDITKILMPMEVIKAISYLKIACTQANKYSKKLDQEIANAIIDVCEEIINNKYNKHFPLSIWQSGSGTQTNMNVNEVISTIASRKIKKKIHENDHVNMSQSTNDVFASAMNISTIIKISNELIPAMAQLNRSLWKKIREFDGIIKIGRTHMMDAIPMHVSQEIEAWNMMVTYNRKSIINFIEDLKTLPIGGTAIGTMINTPQNFDTYVVSQLSKRLNINFKVAKNKFYFQSTHDSLINVHSLITTFATSLNKMANDIRILASGPNSGINELFLPKNEPGSSIMPGKINPTQVEIINMICAQVMANQTLVSFANSQGQLQLNTYRPIIIYAIINSVEILTKGIISFSKKCIDGLKLNKKTIQKNLDNSLMLVTALSPIIGYEKCNKIVELAQSKNITLKQATLELGFISEEEFNKIINFKKIC